MAVDPDDYVAIEERLTELLQDAWAPIAASVFAEISDAVVEGDFDKAYKALTKLSAGAIANDNREEIADLLLKAKDFGAQTVAQGEALLVEAAEAEALMEQVMVEFTEAMEAGVTETTYDHMLQLIADAETGVLAAEDELLANRFVKEFVSFKEVGDNAIQTVSSLHSSRMAVYGFTAEAELRNVTEYQLQAVRDGRTSAFCRMIHGRTFKVVDARESILDILGADHPNELKHLQPWPDQDPASIAEYESMSDEELVEEGLHIPPFHPWCRTLLVPVKESVELVEKFNPNHDELGRFTSGDGAGGKDSSGEGNKSYAEAVSVMTSPDQLPRLLPEMDKRLRDGTDDKFDKTQIAGLREYRALEGDYEPRTEKHVMQETAMRYSRDSTRLNAYVSGSLDMEEFKKSLNGTDVEYGLQQLKERAKELDDMLAKSKVPEDVMVFRAVDNRSLGEDPGVGMVFQDPAYGSTSIDVTTAYQFLQTDTTDEFPRSLLRIQLDAGSPGYYLGNNVHRSAYPNEHEMLLPRDTKYEVISVEELPTYPPIKAYTVKRLFDKAD